MSSALPPNSDIDRGGQHFALLQRRATNNNSELFFSRCAVRPKIPLAERSFGSIQQFRDQLIDVGIAPWRRTRDYIANDEDSGTAADLPNQIG